MEHNWKPRNFRKLDDADRTAEGFNPFCGDMITLYLKVEDDVVADVGFQGSGCAISPRGIPRVAQQRQEYSWSMAAILPSNWWRGTRNYRHLILLGARATHSFWRC